MCMQSCCGRWRPIDDASIYYCGLDRFYQPWGSNGPEPGADGGAIYTDGKVSFFEDALFQSNEGDVSGAGTRKRPDRTAFVFGRRIEYVREKKRDT